MGEARGILPSGKTLTPGQRFDGHPQGRHLFPYDRQPAAAIIHFGHALQNHPVAQGPGSSSCSQAHPLIAIGQHQNHLRDFPDLPGQPHRFAALIPMGRQQQYGLTQGLRDI